MVSLATVQASNSQIATTLPARLVSVFVGATSGIGAYTLKEFAKHAREPKVYFVGRSQEAGDRITAECKALNPQGDFIFIKADVSLIKNVDAVCRDIKSKETTINLLFLSQGVLVVGVETSEGLQLSMALPYYSRLRFIVNLLPLLQKARGLRRVVSVFAGTKEGQVDVTNLQAKGVSLMAQRGHITSMMTLAFEEIAKRSPEVSFVHDYPGFVKSGITRGGQGVTGLLMKGIYAILAVSNDECGARHVYLATSSRYPPKSSHVGDEGSGVPLDVNVSVGTGTDGKSGSGVYSVGNSNETCGQKVVQTLQVLRKADVNRKVWEHTMQEFNRITGVEMV